MGLRGEGQGGGGERGRPLSDDFLRVPLLARVPGMPPRRIDAEVGLVDLAPTLLEAVDVKPDLGLWAQMDGISLLGAMRGEPLSLDSFAEADSPGVHWRSLVTRDGWKGVLDRDSGEFRLYRLIDDPREVRDVAARYPDRAAAVRARLTAIESRFEPGPSGAVTRGTWKAARDGERTRLFDISADPYLTSDESARQPAKVLEMAAEFMRAAAAPSPDRRAPTEELRRRLRETGYW